MSKENNNEYISKNIYSFSLTASKPEIIFSLITEISNLEEKKEKIKTNSNPHDDLDFKGDIQKLKQLKLNIDKEIKSLSMNLLLDISNKDNLIKKKKYSIKEISKKINNYKNILSTYEYLAFNSPVLSKYLFSNNYNQFLSDEQIDDILSKTQNITKNDNLIQKTEKEFSEKKEELRIVKGEKNKILNKINEIKENIQMLKEEKLIINNELINYISLKETFESIIKTNLTNLIQVSNTNIKSNENIQEEINLEKNVFININNNNYREKYSRNRANNNINDIQEINNNNNLNEISNNNSNNFENKKIFDEMTTIYKYELYNLDPNKISNEICTDIIDLINSKLNSKESFNNMGKSSTIEKNKSIKILGKGKSQKINDRYSSFNPQTFSCDSPIIKRTKSNILYSNNSIMGEYKKEIQNIIKNEIKQLINDINEKKIPPNNSNEILSNIIINILKEKGYKFNKMNLMTYISCIFKKAFYEYKISSKIKFINKDYKNIKKLKKKIYDKLQDQLTKLNSKIEYINNTIILQENKLKLLNNNIDNKKNKVDKSELININGNINLSLDEQNYIQLCRKANSFINEKSEIEKEIEIIENDKKLEKYQGELKIKNMKNELNDLNKQIISKENEIEENKRKFEEKLNQIIKEIDNKFFLIKENLISYKIDCSNNDKQNEFNEFIERINNTIKNDYYKTLFNLEKFYIKAKRSEINTSIENLNSNENNLKTNKSFNFKSYRSGNTKNIKSFSIGNDHFSSINNKNMNINYLSNKNNNKINRANIEHSSNNNNIYQNRIKNNYINIFDSYNNLNNYFFQFQTPSTTMSLDKQNNKMETNNIMNKIKNNNNELNNVSNSSPFSSSSKLSFSKKKYYKPNNDNDFKPKNLIYNLRYLSSDKKFAQNENKENNVKEFKLIQNNTINIFKNGRENFSNDNKENNLFQSFSQNKFKSKSKSNFVSKSNTYINLDNINFINKKIFCYFRLFNKDNKELKELNPLKEDISLINLCQFPFNFIKSTIYIDKPNKKIIIFPSNQLEPIEVQSDKIENKKINVLINQIISIYKDYKNFKANNKNKDDINLYVKKIRKQKLYNNIKDDDIKKCCNNKLFSFELILKEEKILEFVFTSYEEYEIVNDNISSLMKDKMESLYEIFRVKKFDYPK